MAEPRPIGLLLSNDQRAVSTNARHMSQQRYQQFLRYDGGVTFGEFLRGWR